MLFDISFVDRVMRVDNSFAVFYLRSILTDLKLVYQSSAFDSAKLV